MDLFLHSPGNDNGLDAAYKKAFSEAVELFVVSAYLTNWDKSLKLRPGCRDFHLIVSSDFGITRKNAIQDVINWLPTKWSDNFRVVESGSHFHPKAVFWKNRKGETFALIGSSNLSFAAFNSNYEANIRVPINATQDAKIRSWLDKVINDSVKVDTAWLAGYDEAKIRPPKKLPPKLRLPPVANEAKLKARRVQLKNHARNKDGLHELFRRCSAGKITSGSFYEQLPSFWGYNPDKNGYTPGNRFQGKGFAIKGKGGDFKIVSKALIEIFESDPSKRDQVVKSWIDVLAEEGEPNRGSFFSEMLCLEYPNEFPLLNKPVRDYLSKNGFKVPRGTSEGEKYIWVAKTLRTLLKQNPSSQAKNLAELDALF